LLPVHQKFSNHKNIFKRFPCLTLEAKINLYTLKVKRNLEQAQILSKDEIAHDRAEQDDDEIQLQSIDLDYNTVHSEILDNIIPEEDDSGVSDFEEEEENKKKVFDIIKIKNIIHDSVKSFFAECQEDEQFDPLIVEKEKMKEENNLDSEEKKVNFIEKKVNYTDKKAEDNTYEVWEEGKNTENTDSNNNTNANETVVEKEKPIISYKQYNFFTDPYSNYNNFTKKFNIKVNHKRRFRDIHPFLKTFNPKFLKKENIDKKIFRRFRKFVKKLYKQEKNIQIFSKNVQFWKEFFTKNMLPPIKINTPEGGLIEHKSFNTQYLIWLFSQKGTNELFELFIKEESEDLLLNFIKEYNLLESKEENIIDKLKEYIQLIPQIYYTKDNEDNCREIKDKIIEEKENIIGKNKYDMESDESENNPFNLNFNFAQDNKQFMKFKEDSFFNNPYSRRYEYSNYEEKRNKIGFYSSSDEEMEISDYN
jgi:hypothetical protein